MINTAQFMATPNHSDMPQMSSPINNLGAAGHEGKPQIVIQPDPDLLNQLEEEKIAELAKVHAFCEFHSMLKIAFNLRLVKKKRKPL